MSINVLSSLQNRLLAISLYEIYPRWIICFVEIRINGIRINRRDLIAIRCIIVWEISKFYDRIEWSRVFINVTTLLFKITNFGKIIVYCTWIWHKSKLNEKFGQISYFNESCINCSGILVWVDRFNGNLPSAYRVCFYSLVERVMGGS